MSLSSSAAALEVNNLRKSYGSVQVLREVSLRVEDQSIHGLVGLNGSGKTTTLECILGMQGFDSGEVRVLGLDPARLYKAQGDVVGIFDTPSLHPGLTVRQSLQHARLLCAKPVRSCEDVEALLGISSYRNYKIRHLSLGNKRRASIAHALLGDPRLIILDEPFNGLDAGGVNDVLSLIGDLSRQQGTAFLLSSHQLPYLEQVCSHLAILHSGRILLSDRVEKLFDRYHGKVEIQVSDSALACRLIEETALAQVEFQAGDRLHCELLQGDSADLNSLLVSGGVKVSELVRKQHTLASLFQETTTADASTGAAQD